MLFRLGAPGSVQPQVQREIITELQQPGVIIQLIFANRHRLLLQLTVNTRPALRLITQIIRHLRALFAGHFDQPLEMQAAQQGAVRCIFLDLIQAAPVEGQLRHHRKINEAVRRARRIIPKGGLVQINPAPVMVADGPQYPFPAGCPRYLLLLKPHG
ncbi:hypothetical protein D3C73_1004890 [compost metagenome]